MVRQSFKNEFCLSNLIKEYIEDIRVFEDTINTRELEADHKANLHGAIYSSAFRLLIVEYTKGGHPKNMLPLFTTTLQKLMASDFEFGYWDALTLLSLGILLEVPDNEFDQLVGAVEKRGFLSEDQLLDTLIAYRKPDRHIHQKLQFPKPYATLISATEWGKPIAEKTIKTYLEKKWYRGHSDCGWYNSHKSPHNTYFGYWSFEAAAMVKVLGLDDSSFKDNQYYPYDLVHWRG